jgi:CheY-like chemotaxis protein
MPDGTQRPPHRRSAKADTAVTRPESATPLSSDRILLAEDNPVNQKVATAMLEHLGFCVDVVDNGVEAVIAATMVPYRAILMDCQIPALNGYEATIEIRNMWGASRSSPIIAVTSSVSETDRKRGRAAGMDGFLAKPLSLESLSAGMARWAPDPSQPALSPFPAEPLSTGNDNSPDPIDPDRPALDAEVVGRLERLGSAAGEDLMGQLTTLFLTDADTQIDALRDAFARDDGPALMSLAHTLCGASANLGAAELARLCARLATDGAVGGVEDVDALLQSVESELDRVRCALMSPAASPMSTLFP